MRHAVKDFIPTEISWRKDKKGFAHPGGEWLKEDLKEGILENYFNKNADIFSLGIINRDKLIDTYKDFCNQPSDSGNIDSGEIFRCISLEIWLKQFQNYVKES